MSKARLQALHALQGVDKGMTVQEALERTRLCGDERRFCSDLVYGVLRTRPILHAKLREFLPKWHKLPPEVVHILSMGAYAVLFQDKAQPYAVVNEMVALAKRRYGQALANVVNGTLRRLLSMSPRADEDMLAQMALPQDIEELWRRAYGEKAAARVAQRSLRRPWTGLRVNALHAAGPELLRALGACAGGETVGKWGMAFPAGAVPREVQGEPVSHWLGAGALSYQAAGSQLIMQELGLLEAWQNTPLWDACAGVGGKTFLMLERGLPVAWATDSSTKRLRQLQADVVRMHLVPPALGCCDARHPPLTLWDGNILVDAPCSGLGVLARRPDIKERFSRHQLPQLTRLQWEILTSTSSLLPPGRELAWITCTLNPGENEDLVDKFLKTSSQFELVCQWQTPHDHPWLEGMYGARMRRK